MSRLRLLACLSFALGLPTSLSAEPVSEFVLDNGLTLLVKPDHRAPVVVSQVWYKVGASYEYDGITGVSHMLEHMMFKGTENLEPGEFSRRIAAEGGEENAFTGRDYTAYFQTLERSRLPVSFELEAERMARLSLDDSEFQKERQVVAEERRMRTDDKPKSLAYESFNAMSYQTSPYRQPVIGWMKDIQHYELADLEAWYRRYYAPNNAVLVVAGDVQPKAVYQLAQKHFGIIRPQVLKADKARPEVPQQGAKRMALQLRARLPYLLMGYKVPSLATAEHDWEPYALDVLAAILDGDDGARISRQLIRGRQVATSASADYDLYARLNTMLTLRGEPRPDADLPTLEQALKDQITTLQTEIVAPAELRRVKTRVVANDVYEKDSLFYQAMALGLLETVGVGWRKYGDYVASIQAVTAEQVQAVARKYLLDKNLNVATITPLAQSDSDQGGADHEG